MRRAGQSAGVIGRANAVRLTPALLKEAMRALDALTQYQKGDFTARGMALLHLLEEKRPEIVTPWARAALLLALDLRLSALERLCERPEWRFWLHGSRRSDLSYRLHDALLAAAATERLIEQDDRAAFELGRFLKMVLRRCEPEGKA